MSNRECMQIDNIVQGAISNGICCNLYPGILIVPVISYIWDSKLVPEINVKWFIVDIVNIDNVLKINIVYNKVYLIILYPTTNGKN